QLTWNNLLANLEQTVAAVASTPPTPSEPSVRPGPRPPAAVDPGRARVQASLVPASRREDASRAPALDPEPEAAAPEPEGPFAGLALLQHSAGNAAVARLLRQLAPPAPAPAPASAPAERLPSWTDAQLSEVQRQLRRLGLYRGQIDHDCGP